MSENFTTHQIITKLDNNTAGRAVPIAFLTDAPPYLAGGHGCHVLSYNLISFLKPFIRLVITRRMRRSVSQKQIKSALEVPSVFYPDLSSAPSYRFLSMLKSLGEVALARLWSKRICHKIVKSGARRIFACCGADPWFLWVIEFFKRYSNLPVDVYLVDEFESSALLNGQVNFAKTVAGWEKRILPEADRVFAISKGFVEHLKNKSGLKNCHWLPIPIPLEGDKIRYIPPSFTNETKKIAYFGAVNPLYVGGIKDILENIRILNAKKTDSKYRLVIMSYTEPETVFSQIGAPADFEFLHKADIETCRKIMSESLAIFMPYTFEQKHRIMVSTSFPSRLAETIKIGRPLLVYGPDYASLPCYFKENNLNFVVTDRMKLADALQNMEKYDNPDTINGYETILKKYHSAEALKNILNY